MKADFPARSRGSLDDILRHGKDLKSLVCGILQRLEILLQQATCISRRKYDPGREMDQDSISSVSDSDCSTHIDDGSQRCIKPKIRLVLQQTVEQIRSLHEISSLLRRPTITDKEDNEERDETMEIRKQHRARDMSTAGESIKEAVTPNQYKKDKERENEFLDRHQQAPMVAPDPATTKSELPSPDANPEESQIDPELESPIQEFQELNMTFEESI
ncbi:hypothetical protein F4782DRAFT_416022 [Xylaria castorea]|nr:hypothetical protein F4782DRAFT_416022 [Xylaria castorea]